MEKPAVNPNTIETNLSLSSKDVPSHSLSLVAGFLESTGVSSETIQPNHDTKDFYSQFIGGLLKVDRLERSRVSCLLSVKPSVSNMYGGLHGGAVAAVAEVISSACARTVVGKDKQLFLGELSMSYLSAAPCNAEVRVDGSVVRSGRNLTVIAVEFRLKESGRLAFTARSTFYNMPVASL